LASIGRATAKWVDVTLSLTAGQAGLEARLKVEHNAVENKIPKRESRRLRNLTWTE